MPKYEYRCLECQRRFEVFFSFEEYGTRSVTCSYCGSSRVQRRIGRIRIARSDESRLENLSDNGDLDNLDGLEENPRALGKMMRKFGQESGEELPPEFNEVVNRLEAGQQPGDIEKDLPDLGLGDDDGDMGGMGGFGGMEDLDDL
jgi:putative FmdB family regulatory protein